MIEVRIRHEDEDESVRLMDWPATDLDRVLDTLGSWSVIHDISEAHSAELLSGQIVVQDGAAFFEVVIHEADR